MRQTALRQCGVTLIEVLVAVVVTLIGLLGMVALQMRAYATETESYQRAHAAILLEDMATRIRANSENAAAYVATNIGIGSIEDCTVAATAAQRDLCQWSNLLRGVAEQHEGNNVGAMTAGRGCITNPTPALYVITVAWEGNVPSAASPSTCGQGAFVQDNLRRTLSTVVRVADLGS
jgi:type IV pilus assembly protein PilV